MSHSHRVTPDVNVWLLYLSWHILCPVNTAVGKIMKYFFVVCSKVILPVFRYDSYLMDQPAGGCRFLVFLLLMLLNCPPNMCRTLNPLDQLHKKWLLRKVLKTSLVHCSLNSASPYTSKYLNNGGSIQNDNTDAKCEIFYKRTKCPEASQ